MSRSIYLQPWEAPMRILLDENFPLALVGRLQQEGYPVDHIILLGIRGTTDRAIVICSTPKTSSSSRTIRSSLIWRFRARGQ
ncbi:MAG: DUF5615 family PIN-like protein [Candidatus Binataceae bacterium]